MAMFRLVASQQRFHVPSALFVTCELIAAPRHRFSRDDSYKSGSRCLSHYNGELVSILTRLVSSVMPYKCLAPLALTPTDGVLQKFVGFAETELFFDARAIGFNCADIEMKSISHLPRAATFADES